MRSNNIWVNSGNLNQPRKNYKQEHFPIPPKKHYFFFRTMSSDITIIHLWIASKLSCTLPEINGWPLKINGGKMTFPFRDGLFSGAKHVKLPGGKSFLTPMKWLRLSLTFLTTNRWSSEFQQKWPEMSRFPPENEGVLPESGPFPPKTNQNICQGGSTWPFCWAWMVLLWSVPMVCYKKSVSSK